MKFSSIQKCVTADVKIPHLLRLVMEEKSLEVECSYKSEENRRLPHLIAHITTYINRLR